VTNGPYAIVAIFTVSIKKSAATPIITQHSKVYRTDLKKECTMSAAPSVGITSPVAKAILGRSIIFKGQILSRENLAIEGEVEGTIDMIEHRLTIGTEGNVRANVKARDIELFGSMQGSIEAVNKVYIRKGAKFVGDIQCGGIVIEDGAYIKAGIDLSRKPAGEQHSTANGANGRDSSFDPSESRPLRSLSDEVRLPGAMQ
jgi:cytoskeletal protein CcmA (bactofilin family)